MSLSKLLRSALLSSSLCLVGSYSAFAQFTIATDNFGLTDHPTGDLTLTGPTSGIPFYTRNATGGGYSASIGNDATFNSSVLQHVDTIATTGNAIIGVLPLPIVLANTNDFITLSFQFRYLNIGTATANAAGFRFGIWGDGGTTVTANGQTAVSDNDSGYYVQTGVGTGTPGSGNLFYNEAGGTSPIGGGGDRVAVNTTAGNGVAINDGNIHSATFTITRTNATTVSLSVSYDGAAAFIGNSTSNIRTAFNEIAFNDGFVTSPVHFAIDNVQVTSSVPEPGSALLCAFGVAAVAGSRRRKV